MLIKFIRSDETYSLRHDVLRPHKPLSDVMYDTDELEGTFHVGVYIESELISVASFNKEHLAGVDGEKHYRLRAMATLPEYRKLGLGRAIVELGEEKLQEESADILWCKARTEVEEYYEKLGFKPLGDVFDYPTLGPHIVMVKTTKKKLIWEKNIT